MDLENIGQGVRQQGNDEYRGYGQVAYIQEWESKGLQKGKWNDCDFNTGGMDEETLPSQFMYKTDLRQYGTVSSQMATQSVISVTSKKAPNDYCALMDINGNKVAWALPSDGTTAICEGSLPVGTHLYWTINPTKNQQNPNQALFVSEKLLQNEKNDLFPGRVILVVKKRDKNAMKPKVRSSSAEIAQSNQTLDKGHIITSSSGTRTFKVATRLGKRARSPPVTSGKYLR